MKYKFLNVLLALTIGVSQAGYLVSSASSDSDGVKEYTLPSGQMVYLRENHEQPIVTVDTWVNTGSVNETKENNGVSHFLEHLIFKGTDEYKAGEIDRILEAKGAKFNAATSDDFTHYYITTASGFFEETLKLHASMLRRASIPPDELLQERKVVQEEINRATDNPNHKRFDALSKILYQNHGYGLDTLGPKENIANISREKILGYYQYWYSPKNFKTVISGDIQPEKALALVQKYFADGAAGKTAQSEKVSDYTPPAVGLPKPLESIQSKVITDNSVSQVYFTLGFPGPSISQRSDIFALDVAMLALGSGSSSRLYQALHEDKPLALSVGAGNMTQKYSGLLYVDASMKAENQEAFKKELAYQLKNLKENGITTEELEKAKTQTIKDFIFQNESSEGVASGIGYNVTIGNLKDYTEYVSNVQKVTLADVKQVLQRYLDFNKAVVIELRPPEKNGKPEARELANQAWVKQIATVNLQEQPGNGTAVKNTQVSVKPSDITKKVLPNGLTLITKPMKSSQTVAFKLFVKGGQGVETIPGLTDMLAPMMMKGTLNRTAEQLSQELESKGMNLSVSAHEDYIEVSGNSVADDFGSLFLVFEDVLNNPLFSPKEIDKERSRLKDTIVANRDNPSSIAMENLSLGLYPHHPYGNVGKRVETQLDKLDQAALKKYYATYFIPSNM
ncbi:MAG: insulinase family protein, partial [Cyanobacteria bacterium]|nr:insulinase family protein [Cyanobacteriota bacterium]